MVDFHSHILPGMDDGSASVKESLEMLQLSYSQGITKIVATPHFYAAKEAPDRFLTRRSRAWEELRKAVLEEDQVFPDIYPGAEVCYYVGITRTRNLSQFCIGASNVLLLEMPFHQWSGRMVSEVIELAQDSELKVMLAHIDRYFSSQTEDVWDTLADKGVLFQVNASCFSKGWLSRRRAIRLLRQGRIAALGSDCHNMKDRKPNLGEAFGQIEKREGKESLIRLNNRVEKLLE